MKDTESASKDNTKKSSFLKEFEEFINRGNVMDLAVGVIIGGAFTSIVNSLVNDIIMPVVSLVAGGVDFTSLAIDIPNFFGTDDAAHIAYGNFIQNVVYFLLVALSVFLMVRTINRIRRKEEDRKAKLLSKAAALKSKIAKKVKK